MSLGRTPAIAVSAQREGSAPKTDWVLGRKGNRVFGVGDEGRTGGVGALDAHLAGLQLGAQAREIDVLAGRRKGVEIDILRSIEFAAQLYHETKLEPLTKRVTDQVIRLTL